MRVTDEMVERACRRDQVSDVTDDDRKHMHDVLRAALADVPEPSAWERAAVGQHGRDKDRIELLLQRAEAAEARLATVREWAEFCYDRQPISASQLLRILDGEP